MSKPSGSGGATATAGNRRAVDFRRQLDTHTRTLVESFGGLLRSAKITNPQNTAKEDFQINVATASLATAGEGLLRQIREVKLAVMLQDEAAMDLEVDQALAMIAQERGELEIELEALSNDLRAAYAKVAMGGQVETLVAQDEDSEMGERGQWKVKEEEKEARWGGGGARGGGKEGAGGSGDVAGMDVVKEEGGGSVSMGLQGIGTTMDGVR
eukprot:jgi/Undpi1/6757/HiC_scaffold_21.g09236.m1